MKKQTYLRFIEPAAHIIFWVGLAILLLKSDKTSITVERIGQGSESFDTYSPLWIVYASSALIFYGNIIVLFPKLFQPKKYAWYSISLIIWAVFVVSVEYTIMAPQYGPLLEFYEIQYASNHLVFLLFSIVYVFVKNTITAEAESQRVKQAHLIDELMFLKAQLNPHFLFNTINNIFSIAQQNDDDEVAQHLADLTKVLRYSLYESNSILVSLEKELHFLKSYITMSMLKFSEDDLQLDFEIEGEIAQHQIAPLLLVPLIENAFKHGPIPGTSAFLNIRIQLEDGVLTMIVENSYKINETKGQFESGGIGLNNLRRRLELLYESAFIFTVEDKNDQFRTELKLMLNNA